MIEFFVPYIESIELKELGFDKPCFGYYDKQGKFHEGDFNWYIFKEKTKHINKEKEFDIKKICLCPLYTQAFKWFRDKHKILCHIEMGENPENYYPVFDYLSNVSYKRHMIVSHKHDTEMWFNTYEEAELEALKKLIDKLKNS